MNKKYELTTYTIEHEGVRLYMIRACRSFGSVRRGDHGGFIESEVNLSHEGDCWVYCPSKAYEQCRIEGDATVKCASEVFGSAKITDSASVSCRSVVGGGMVIKDHAIVSCNSTMTGRGTIGGTSVVYESEDNATPRSDIAFFALMLFIGVGLISGLVFPG